MHAATAPAQKPQFSCASAIHDAIKASPKRWAAAQRVPGGIQTLGRTAAGQVHSGQGYLVYEMRLCPHCGDEMYKPCEVAVVRYIREARPALARAFH